MYFIHEEKKEEEENRKVNKLPRFYAQKLFSLARRLTSLKLFRTRELVAAMATATRAQILVGNSLEARQSPQQSSTWRCK